MNITPWIPLILTIFCLILAYLVVRHNLNNPVHRLFALFLLSLAAWGLIIFGMRASPDIGHAYTWEKALPPVASFSAVTLYHFSIRFTATSRKQWLLILAYSCCALIIPLSILGLIFSGMQVKSYGYAPILGPVAPVQILFTYGFAVAALINLIKKYMRSFSSDERNRLLYIISGLIISLVGGVCDVLPILGLPLYPGLIIGYLVLCVLTTVAILKHNLLDIRVVLRKGTAYFVTSSIIALPFLIFALILV